jgi:hypothetical protein
VLEARRPGGLPCRTGTTPVAPRLPGLDAALPGPAPSCPNRRVARTKGRVPDGSARLNRRRRR